MTGPDQSELIREDYGELNVIFVHSKIDDLGLSVFAFRVYAHLARRASNPRGCAWPSITKIAEVCQIGETKVREALRELDERRMIVREARECQSYLVRMTPPSLWRESSEGVVRHANPSPREPSATRTIRHTNHPGSPREPEVYPLKETHPGKVDAELPSMALSADEQGNAERDAREINAREITRTMPGPLNTVEFRAAWLKWVVHCTLTFHRGQPIPFATADAHLKICAALGADRAVAAIDNAISKRLREPGEAFSKNANHRTPNSRSFAQSGDYAGITDK